MSRIIYLDNATTMRLAPEILKTMEPYFLEYYGLPTTEYGHSFGLKAGQALETAREVIAQSINASQEEIIFTSSGTESNNLAIKGVAFANKKRHLITSMIEHRSVLDVIKSLEKKGFKASYLRVDEEGFVDIEGLKREINNETLLASIQYVNQEIGTIQNIEEMGKICAEEGILFHVDAVQCYTKIPIDVKKLHIDLLSISAHKIGGPKGIAALYIKKGLKLNPIIEGSYNEFGLRSGAENIPGAIGFARAVEIADESQVAYMKKLRDKLIEGLLEIPHSKLNGPRGEKRICNNVNITFKYVEGESVLLHLDMRGIIVTTGSACFSRTLEPSHVILALGLKHEDAHGSVRFSLSKYNTEEEIIYTIENVREVIENLRKISPLGG